MIAVAIVIVITSGFVSLGMLRKEAWVPAVVVFMAAMFFAATLARLAS